MLTNIQSLALRKREVSLLVFAAAALYFQSATTTNLPATMQDTITLSLGILYEALPFVFLGVSISILIQAFISEKFFLRLLPKNSFFRRLTLSLFGMFLPVCECGNVPLSRGLMAKGLKPNEVLAFLFAAPIINPVTIYTTAQAFQGVPQVVIVRVAAALFIAKLVKENAPTKTMATASEISLTAIIASLSDFGPPVPSLGAAVHLSGAWKTIRRHRPRRGLPVG